MDYSCYNDAHCINEFWQPNTHTHNQNLSFALERKIGSQMPTVLRIGPYRFFFYSNENNEPAHIHIQRDNMLAKFWLTHVALASSIRFSPKN